MEKYIYHATVYKTLILKNGFDLKHSYKERNDKLGAGESIYFTFEQEVAELYKYANANNSFLPIIIEELEKADEEAGFLLRSIYENGYEEGWNELFKKYGENILRKYNYADKGYDLNDVADLSEYIRGTKNIIENNEPLLFNSDIAHLPEVLIKDAKKMGITTLPEEPEILRYTLKKNVKLKKIGYTDISVEEATKAKKEGYDGIIFKNKYSINDKEEIAIFNIEVLLESNIIKDKINKNNITIEIIQRFIYFISELYSEKDFSMEDFFDNVSNTSFFDVDILSKEEILESLKNILKIMYILKIIEINKYNNFKITKNNIDLINYIKDEDFKEEIILNIFKKYKNKLKDKKINVKLDKQLNIKYI